MARLDTGWHAHPKVLGLGLPAMGLHAWSISYCDDARSDGFIPMGSWPALAGAGAAVKALLTAGLWERIEGGFRLHDYLDYNRSRLQIEAYMAAKTAAGQAGGQASAQARARRSAQASAQANGQQMLKQNSTPGPGPLSDDVAAAAVEMPATRARAREDGPALRSLGTVLARLDHAPEHVEAERDRQRQQQRQKISFSETGETA